MDNESVGMRDLGQNVSRVLARVKKGESLVVTDHGRTVARLIPYVAHTTLDELMEAGEIIPPSSDLQEFLAHHRPVESAVTGSEILQAKGATLYDIAACEIDLEQALGFPVTITTRRGLTLPRDAALLEDAVRVC